MKNEGYWNKCSIIISSMQSKEFEHSPVTNQPRAKNDGSWNEHNISKSTMKSEKEIGLTVPEG